MGNTLTKPAILLPLSMLFATACLGGGNEDGPPSAGGSPPQGAPPVVNWNTDWSLRSIDLNELTVGIGAADPRDRIPPLDEPAFETVEEASQWLAEREPVVLLEMHGEARAYPLQILTLHEIVNDRVGGVPIAITYCPLCNSAVTFEATVEGRVLRFGTSGLLRNSDLVMWDRQTESLWQQVTGEAIVGELTGTRLKFVPSPIVRWADFKERFPEGKVLSHQTGYAFAYGTNPYAYYDSSERPFLFDGEIDARYPALERVVGVTVGGANKAYPFSLIAEERAVNDEVAGEPVLVLWGAADTASALDARGIAEGRSVGVGVAYLRTVQGRTLTFEPQGDGVFVDSGTGSMWNILGKAVDGPLAGAELPPAVQTNHFWFAWAAFFGESPVYTGASEP